MALKFNSVLIIGMGLIGSSISRALIENNVANNVLEEGGSFQEASQVSNLSGWALYSYVQQKSKIAADGYEDWLKGEMLNNESIKLEVDWENSDGFRTAVFPAASADING